MRSKNDSLGLKAFIIFFFFVAVFIFLFIMLQPKEIKPITPPASELILQIDETVKILKSYLEKAKSVLDDLQHKEMMKIYDNIYNKKNVYNFLTNQPIRNECDEFNYYLLELNKLVNKFAEKNKKFVQLYFKAITGEIYRLNMLVSGLFEQNF